jgi:hypothetical protein
MYAYSEKQGTNMTELNIKAGNEIVYSSAAGRLRATVDGISIGATAKRGHSIAWLHITTHATRNRPYPSQLRIPADNNSLLMFKIELA